MKKLTGLLAAVALLVSAGIVAAQQPDTATPKASLTIDAPTTVAAEEVLETPASVTDVSEPEAKKCSFASDCKYGKCKSGKCGSCSFKSDCKGWGKCKSGQCGACSFDSDCKGHGKCKSGQCSKSPY